MPQLMPPPQRADLQHMNFSAEQKNALRRMVSKVLASALICLFGLILFTQRSPNLSSPLLQLTYDTLQYVSLIEGDIASEPFASRFLIVLLGQLIPSSAIDAIYIINIISMFILVFCLLTILGRYTHSSLVKLTATLLTCLSFSFAYNFTNPFLTDLPALAALMAALLFINQQRFIPAVAFFATSIFFRETAIVLSPLFFLFKSWKTLLTAFFIISAAYFFPKLIIGGGIYRPDFVKHDAISYVTKAILSYGSLWAFPSIAIFTHRRILGHLDRFFLLTFMLSLLGSIGSSLTATDITRMYVLMTPAIAIGTCMILDSIYVQKLSLRIMPYYIFAIAITAYSLLPNILTDSQAARSLEDFAMHNSSTLVLGLIMQLLCIFFIFKNHIAILKNQHPTTN